MIFIFGSADHGLRLASHLIQKEQTSPLAPGREVSAGEWVSEEVEGHLLFHVSSVLV